MTGRVRRDGRELRHDRAAPVTVVAAGTVPYAVAWDWQRRLVARRAAGDVGDVLLLLEHPPVYTAGPRADAGNLLFDDAERHRRGIELYRVDRGGDFTYHGPGQVVGYPILRLAGPRVVDYVRAVEEVNLRLAAGYGVAAGRVAGRTGVWVGDAKLTAVGVRVSARGVTAHGWATNVTTDLSHFAGIVPCGLPGTGVTSLAQLGVDTDVAEAIERSTRAFGAVFGTTLQTAAVADLGLSDLIGASA